MSYLSLISPSALLQLVFIEQLLCAVLGSGDAVRRKVVWERLDGSLTDRCYAVREAREKGSEVVLARG